MKMYMHLIDSKPAFYEPGRQIVFAKTGRYARKGITLVATLAEIHEHQFATVEYRTRRGWPTDDARLSYTVVEVPSSRPSKRRGSNG